MATTRNMKAILGALGGALLIASIAAVLFAVLFFTKSSEKPPPPTIPPTSVPKGWRAAAALLNEAHDPSVDPCDDFYHFACGGYIKDPKNALNGYNFRGPYSTEYAENVINTVTDAIVKIDITTGSTPDTLKKTKHLFNKCMNPSSARAVLRDYMAIVNGEFGGWPALSPNYEQGNASTEATIMGKLGNQFGSDGWLATQVSFAAFSPSTDFQTWTLYLEAINPIATTGSAQIPSKQALIHLLKRVTRRVSSVLSLGVSADQIQADATALADLMVKLYRKSAQSGQHLTQMTLEQAEKKWSFFNWREYLTAYAGTYLDPDVLLKGSFGVVSPSYFDQAQRVLKALPTDQKDRIMQNLFIWNLFAKFQLHRFMDDTELKQAFNDYEEEVSGLKVPLDATVQCAKVVLKILPFPTSRLYVDNRFNKVNGAMPKAGVSYIADLVKDGVRRMMRDVKWLSFESKQHAYAKLNRLAENIAYPEWLTNDMEFDRRFMALNISARDDVFVASRNVFRFQQSASIGKIGSKASQKEWPFAPAVVNAVSMYNLNSIFIDAAFVDEANYNSEYPMAVNYGGVGTVIGHEMMHQFTGLGVEFNGHGLQKPWMDAASKAEFDRMTQCVVNEYNHICYDFDDRPRACVNGERSMPDNMADNGGISASYRAYKRAVEINGAEEHLHLPGRLSPYSMEQIFFMSYAYGWCTNINDRTLSIWTQLSHAPNSARIMGVMPNIPEFAKAFNCPVGSPMAPKHHCNVWIPKS